MTVVFLHSSPGRLQCELDVSFNVGSIAVWSSDIGNPLFYGNVNVTLQYISIITGDNLKTVVNDPVKLYTIFKPNP